MIASGLCARRSRVKPENSQERRSFNAMSISSSSLIEKVSMISLNWL